MDSTRHRQQPKHSRLLGAFLIAMLSATVAAVPRIAPIADKELTDAHRALLKELGVADTARLSNQFRVFLRHPALVRGVMPFANYIGGTSTLSPRHREILSLRTAWLARSEYQWARHARQSKNIGITNQDLRRIAAGPDERGWDDPLEPLLLRLADELHVDSFVSDKTWSAMASRYARHQMMDAVFTVAEMTMLAETSNSLMLDRDAGNNERFPPNVPYRVSAEKTGRRLIGEKARIAPLEPADWSPEVRRLLDPTGSGRSVAAVYRTFAQHTRLYAPRQVLSEYIRTQSTLDARTRELLIMRIGALCRSDYEWAAHAPAGRRAGMTDADVQHVLEGPRAGSDAPDDTLLKAVDELYTDRTISDGTWQRLASRFNEQQLLDILITTGGYHMVSMALNSFGVQLEPGGEGLPTVR
ncbi:MAG TPA: carboxymuconolactone decarboxylase family protein [Vicinamibacterales bacterium]|nr:carboxymuconolactone decarboxylase family protein [Vicinamibacterales bacterium]